VTQTARQKARSRLQRAEYALQLAQDELKAAQENLRVASISTGVKDWFATLRPGQRLILSTETRMPWTILKVDTERKAILLESPTQMTTWKTYRDFAKIRDANKVLTD